MPAREIVGSEKRFVADVVTLFPEMFSGPFGDSITKRAVDRGLLDIHFTDFRDYSFDKHRHVDDAPYGGGAGMVMQAAPVCDAYEALCERIGKRPRVLYMTPQGQTFNQKIAEELALPPVKIHCSILAEDAIKAAIADYKKKKGLE